MPTTIPARDEAAPFYFTYIEKVGDGDVIDILRRQGAEALALLPSISNEHSLYRYADGKWSIREVLGHVIDAERIFVHRALWFARRIPGDLPGYDQDAALSAANADARSWPVLVDEYRALRDSTISFFAGLPEEAWGRRGVASDTEVTVRALAYIVAGHLAHHLGMLEERYGVGR
jgi:uncharacterized damage-inducible protein DinB